MNDTAILLLLLVAAGLLVLAGTAVGRARGRSVSNGDAALMAGMTGVTIGFLTVFLMGSPLLLGPLGIGGVLVGTWASRGQVGLVGAFLVGAGALVALMNGMWLLNDIADPAVSLPGWTPIPLAGGVAAVILGMFLVITAARRA